MARGINFVNGISALAQRCPVPWINRHGDDQNPRYFVQMGNSLRISGSYSKHGRGNQPEFVSDKMIKLAGGHGSVETFDDESTPPVVLTRTHIRISNPIRAQRFHANLKTT